MQKIMLMDHSHFSTWTLEDFIRSCISFVQLMPNVEYFLKQKMSILAPTNGMHFNNVPFSKREFNNKKDLQRQLRMNILKPATDLKANRSNWCKKDLDCRLIDCNIRQISWFINGLRPCMQHKVSSLSSHLNVKFDCFLSA